MKSYPPPKNKMLNWFHLIVNVFHISVCPSSNPWPYFIGRYCCSKEVELSASYCNGKLIPCPSYPCASGNIWCCYFREFLSVSGTAQLHSQTWAWIFYSKFTQKNVVGDSDKNFFSRITQDKHIKLYIFEIRFKLSFYWYIMREIIKNFIFFRSYRCGEFLGSGRGVNRPPEFFLWRIYDISVWNKKSPLKTRKIKVQKWNTLIFRYSYEKLPAP